MKSKLIAVAVLVLSVVCNAASAAAVPPGRDVRILFCDCGGGLTENSVIQPFNDWYIGVGFNKTSVKEMMLKGWKLASIVPMNAKQLYIAFTK